MQPLVSDDGSLWRIFSRFRRSARFNGAFYDVDQGVAPDSVLDTDSSDYARETLTDDIYSLI